ncbi:MAG: serine/threonine-protein kinase [Myxococcota bacterium]
MHSTDDGKTTASLGLSATDEDSSAAEAAHSEATDVGDAELANTISDSGNLTTSPGRAVTGDPSPVTETAHSHTTDIGDAGRAENILPGDLVGEYIIRKKIGWGGCSTVYAAEHRASGQQVAVKIMHPGLAESPKQVQRFEQEARALGLIKHPTIVDVHHVGYTLDGRPFIVMELLIGTNLASLIHTRGRLSPGEALEVLRPIGGALSLAHQSGIIHRDIKASNIIIVELDGRRQVKLLDFGIAKLVHSHSGAMQTTVGHVLGTPHSMAPEQIRGQKIDGRTDVYALGALLYRLLTGKHPFEGCDALTLTRMHIHTPPPPPSQSAPVSPALDAVVRRAMEKDPAKRYSSVEMFVDALAEAVGSASATAVGDIARAVAIYVEGRVEVGSETDDDLLDDLINIMDIAEEEFTRSEFLVPLQTGNAILGAVLVPGGGDEETARLRAMDVATELDAKLAARHRADDRIDINLCLHIANANVRAAAERSEIVGGPIVDVGSWAPQQTMDGVCATPETLGFALEARDRNSRSYVRIGSRRSSTL